MKTLRNLLRWWPIYLTLLVGVLVLMGMTP